MTKTEQKKFVKGLLKTAGDGLMEKADQWPTEWTERELRELVADKLHTMRVTLDKRSIEGRRYSTIRSSLI